MRNGFKFLRIIGFWGSWRSWFFLLLLLPALAHSVENPLFGYTHILPSPFTLRAGTIKIGSTTGVGITDSVDLQTYVLADVYQIYNATARISVLDFPGLALGLSLGYQYVNLNDISSNNPSLPVGAWLPGGVIGLEVLPDVAVFLGGTLFFPNKSFNGMAIDASGLLQGAQFGTDISWAYNPHVNQTGNVISAGVSYNNTFDLFGFGLSHHWKGLHLGFHYYPNAVTPKIQPILSGSATVEL